MDTAIVWAAAVSAVPALTAAVLSYRAVVHGKENKAAVEKTSQAVEKVSDKTDENKEALERVEHATNGILTSRIREVLRDELIKHHESTTEMYDLLDAIIRNAQGEDDI